MLVYQNVQISVILFLVFFEDISEDLSSHFKFADDLTAWLTADTPEEAADNLSAELTKLSKEFAKLQIEIQSKVDILHSMGNDILFKRVVGHTDIPGNDLTEKLAKNAAKSAEQHTTTSWLSLTEANNIIKCKAAHSWKTHIELSSSTAKTIDQDFQELHVTNSGIKTTSTQTNA